jgi:N-acetylneuraminate synthase
VPEITYEEKILAKQISIAGRVIGPSAPPYLIAEMSANHGGQFDKAIRVIEAAKAAGADAVKLQTYTPDTITLNCSDPDFKILDGLWAGRTLYDLYAQAYTPFEWHKALFAHARNIGLTIFSSPFDFSAVDLLEGLGAPAYKIASFEVVDLPLIKYVAATGKPMIISTGMASRDEIAEAIDAARTGGCKELVILHCVSSYPAPSDDYNLHTITDIAERFDTVVGLSDHTIDNYTAIASVALGASVIEKHFTLDRQGGGADDSFSIEPSELRALCEGVRVAWSALGEVRYGHKSSDRGNLKYRRSLYFVADLPAGVLIPASAIRSVRPGFGLPPKLFDDVVGRRTIRPIRRNTPVRLEDFE